ncbi:MAG: hypothetical protein JO199_13715 [Candidatus Eremiobacteraeota bacterium]|nr:hypothetical protein [Candidatus Eremiobacteraeota bacterium]
MPLGQSGEVQVIAKDAAGHVIRGTYDHPILLHSSSLAIAPSELTNSSQAAHVAVTWTSSFSGSSGTVIAAADGHSATATVDASSGFVYYDVGSDASTDVTGFQIVAGPDGALYYGALGPQKCHNDFCTSTTGAIGRLDPKTGNYKEIALPSEVLGLLFTSDGALWIAGGISHILWHMPPHTFATPGAIVLPAPGPNATYGPRLLTEDAQNRVWFGDATGHRLLEVAENDPYGALAAYSPPRGPAGTPHVAPYVNGLAYAGDGNLYFVDYNNGVLDRVDPSTGHTTAQILLPQQKTLASVSAAPRFLVNDPVTGRLLLSYFGDLTASPESGGIDSFAYPSTMATLKLPKPPAGTLPDSLSTAVYEGSGLLYYADVYVHALGVVNPKTGKARLMPTQTFLAPAGGTRLSPNGVAALSDGTAWFTCQNNTNPLQPLCIGHVVYLPRWSVFPGGNVTIGIGSTVSQVVGIVESPAADSGPFTAVSASPKVCTASAVADHNFTVTGVSGGTCTVTVTDAHSVRSSVLFEVIGNAGAL